MPKIIKNAEETLLAAARRQALSQGYTGMTMRSVAMECGFSVGTVYNYFENKDVLVARLVLKDWLATMETMRAECAGATGPAAAIDSVHRGLESFINLYSALFSDDAAARSYASAVGQYHTQLREQVAELLMPICEKFAAEPTPQMAVFVAEALITWTTQNKDFDGIKELLLRLF